MMFSLMFFYWLLCIPLLLIAAAMFVKSPDVAVNLCASSFMLLGMTFIVMVFSFIAVAAPHREITQQDIDTTTLWMQSYG